MPSPIARLRSRPVARAILALALLLTTPSACDDEGTGPDDPDTSELPDTIPSGTIEVEDLHVPATDTVTVAGEAVILAMGSVTIDGDLQLLPGATLAILAEDSLIIGGAIALDTTAPGAGAAQEASANGAQSGARVLSIAARDIQVVDDGEVYVDEVHIATVGPAGTVHINGDIRVTDGINSEERGVSGGPGGSVEIGTDAANERWAGHDIQRPFEIFVAGRIEAGDGGMGFNDAHGIETDRVIVATGTAGGPGGTVSISAVEIYVTGTIEAGTGGDGGSCGNESVDLQEYLTGADGTSEGERGVDIDCTAGAGGPGGDVVLDWGNWIEGSENSFGGNGGWGGSLLARAGNGGPGGRGGNIVAVFGLGGATGSPAPMNPRNDAVSVDILSGGNGGNSNSLELNGGDGGSLSLRAIGGGPLPIGYWNVIGPIANGGHGFPGCDAQPFMPGTDGGQAGNLGLGGTPAPSVPANSFTGGNGAEGLGPGSGGSGGFDDSGNRLGPDGTSGVSCNETPSVSSVDPDSATVADGTLIAEVSGDGFAIGNCTATFGGNAVDAECTSATSATIEIPATLQVAGNHAVCIVNGPPGGGPSEVCASLIFYNRPPNLVSVAPAQVERGGADFIATVTANFLVANTAITVNSVAQPTTVAGDQATTTVPSAHIAELGALEIGLVTPDGVSSGNTLLIDVIRPVAQVFTVEPPSFGVGNEPQVVAVTGADFGVGCTLHMGSTALETECTSETAASAVIQPEQQLAGTYDLCMESRDRGLGTTCAQLVITESPPVLTGIEPSQIVSDQDAQIIATGDFFASTTVMVAELAGGSVELQTEVQSRTRAIGTLPGDMIPDGGEYSVAMYTPGFGTSDPAALVVTNPVPTITGLSPEFAVEGGPDFTLEIFGPGMDETSTISFDGTEYEISAFGTVTDVVVVDIPASEIATARTVVVSAFNAPPGGGLSTTQFVIEDPVPVLESLSRSEASVGEAPFEMTLTGPNLGDQADLVIVDFIDGTRFDALTPTEVDPTSVSVEIPAAMLALDTTYSIWVLHTNDYPSSIPQPETDSWGSEALPFDVSAAACEATAFDYPGTEEGLLQEDACTLEFGGSWEYRALFEFSTPDPAIAIDLSADRGSLELRSGGARLDYIGASETTARLAFLPQGSLVEGIVSSGSGNPPATPFTLTILPPGTTDISGCSVYPALVRPAPGDAVLLGPQSVDGSSCLLWIGRNVRGDVVQLGVNGGETIRATATSSDFAPLVVLSCAGPACPAPRLEGTTGGNSSTVEYTIPESAVAGGSVFRLWFVSSNDAFGSYEATVELNPQPVPGCEARDIGADSLLTGQLSSSDCAGPLANQVYERLRQAAENHGEGTHYQRYTVSASASVSVRLGDDFTFPRATFNAFGPATVDLLSADYDYFVFPSRVLSSPSQVVDYTVQTDQLTASEWSNSDCRQVFVVPTMTIPSVVDGQDCDLGGGHRGERYWLVVQAGQTVRANVVSSAFDAYAEIWTTTSSTPVAVDDNSGGGTNARVTYSSPTTQVICVVVRNFADTNQGAHTTTIAFQ